MKDQADYMVALIAEFAKRYGMDVVRAYNYLRRFNGIAFIERHYGIAHTLSFDEVVDSLAAYCRRQGGALA